MTMTRSRLHVSILAAACVAVPPRIAAAQSPVAAATAPATPDATVPADPGLAPQGYSYDPEGRRDPFVSLLRRGVDVQRPTLGARPGGLAGLETNEVTLKGTVESRGGY